MPGQDRPNFSRRRLIAIIAALVAIAAAAGAYLILKPPGNVSHPNAAFKPTKAIPPRPAEPTTTTWPFYGYDAARTKWYKTGTELDPPYQRLWSYRGKKLLEFPPAIGNNGLFLLDDGGALRKLDPATGRQQWRRQLGSLAASSPALQRGVLFTVTLLSSPDSGHGSAFAVRARDGKILWRKELPSRAESSPLTVGSTVIFGTEDGTVFSLDRVTGKTVWTFSANGAVKGGLALMDGRLYFGDYGGTVHAISASTGKPIWSANPGGTFYSTAAAAWGRIYIGNTDGRLYSYTASGDLAWARQTGAYVYSSPAIALVPKLGPTVFAGSYDGNFYAYDAKSGSTRWSFDAGGKISGGATVIGDLVWFADLGNTRNLALRTSDGKQVFEMGTGSFNPVVTDGRRMFIVGYGDMFGYKPKRRAKSPTR
ncbi:MAG: PQQ-like beta-propeller repeat protein [Solirubrobacterales bacterium]|nr:PQQ-like beta-propeller repeat protein [Solirubrobacterales bacterium]